MQRRYNRANFLLAIIVVWGLTPAIICVDAQAQIAFASDRAGNWEIYVMDADGTNQRRLTNYNHTDSSPSWSPGGKRIAFTSTRNPTFGIRGPDFEIYVMDADGTNRQHLTDNLHQEIDPTWSPDGRHIAYASGINKNFEIYVMDAHGRNRGRLTNSGDVHIHNWEPSWSPDGKRIAFTSIRDGNKEVYVMAAHGGNQRRLTNSGDVHIHNWEPSWSPDGKRIAFISDRDEKLNIFVMNADGGKQQNRTKDLHGENPSWSPDGKRIAFVSERDGNKEIYTINADGRRDPRRLTDNPQADTDPAWMAPAFAFAVAPANKKITMWGWLKQVNR